MTTVTITAPGTGSRPEYGTVAYFAELICMGYMPESVRPSLSAAKIDSTVLALIKDMAGPDAKYLGTLAHIRNLITAAEQLKAQAAAR